MRKYHQVENIRIEENQLYLVVDGKSIQRELKGVSYSLASATPIEQTTFELTPSGYGIYWPLIDEDISIDGLLNIEHNPIATSKYA